ncbi:MAG: hypothetical protein AAF432_11465 [Planctomycetota bacterium]
MHVLTKIFIVLVSLLAVFLVPLVVVYAHNENSFKAQYSEAMLEAVAAKSTLQGESIRHATEIAQKEKVIALQEDRVADLEIELGRTTADVGRLEKDLTQSESFKADINSKLATISSALEAGQDVVKSLLDENGNLRVANLSSERQKVELDEALREALLSLQEAKEARRALEEEVQRMTRSQSNTLDQLAQYRSTFGALPSVNTGTLGDGGVTPTIDLQATIVSFENRADGQTFVEIDAGSRDGVEMDWVMTLSENGSFVAKIRIIDVDINRSVGVVTLTGDGQIRMGQRATAYSR